MDGDVSDQVYLALLSGWGAQYYFSSIEDNDGSHTITLPANMNPNADYTIYIESAYDDNRTTLCWKYGSIDILNEGEGPVDNETVPTPTVDETPRISMWYGKVNQHNENGTWMTDPDGVAGAGLYQDWGDEGWGDRKLEYCQRFWPSTVDVVLRDVQEEIVFYTQGNIDGYVSTKPVWECILEEDQVPVLTGSCTIDLTVSPQEIMTGETLTMEWTMTGDIPAEVRVAVASHDSGMWNVGVQYHVSQHIANTGIFEYVIPAGMNPDRDYVVYVDAVLTDDFTTYCWRYGSFDLLADNEGAIEEVIDNLFNTTDRTPRISMWYGKVNQHNENGTWMTDPDGTAGAGNYAQFGDDGWGDRKLNIASASGQIPLQSNRWVLKKLSSTPVVMPKLTSPSNLFGNVFMIPMVMEKWIMSMSMTTTMVGPTSSNKRVEQTNLTRPMSLLMLMVTKSVTFSRKLL